MSEHADVLIVGAGLSGIGAARHLPGCARCSARGAGTPSRVATHFNPAYNPWDQRLCLVPDAGWRQSFRLPLIGYREDEENRCMSALRQPQQRPPRPRRTQPRGDARKQQIIDVALRSFSDNGFRGSSIAEIAERCGMSQAGLLHHFPTKADLLAAVLARRDEFDGRQFHMDENPGGLESLRLLVELVRHNARRAGLVKLFTVVTSEAVTIGHPARKWALTRYRKLEAELAGALQRDIGHGLVRPDVNPIDIARQIFAMMDGLQLQWLLDPQNVDMPALFSDYVESLIERIAS